MWFRYLLLWYTHSSRGYSAPPHAVIEYPIRPAVKEGIDAGPDMYQAAKVALSCYYITQVRRRRLATHSHHYISFTARACL